MGARLLEQLWVLAHLVACSKCIALSWLGFQSGPGRHAWLSPLWQRNGRKGFVHLLQLQAVLSVLESRQWVDGSHRPKTALAARCWLRRRQCYTSVEKWETFCVSRDPCCSQNSDLDNAKKMRLYDGANFSDRHLIPFFRHELGFKIRFYRKILDRITFEKRWVHAASLVVRRGATLESSFPARSSNGISFLEPNPGKVVFSYPPLL